jgi:hypothetical protein
MKGVSVLYDETRKKRVVQIDMDVIVKRREELEDMLDVLIAESRKDDEMVPWEKAKGMLKKAGKV